VLAGSFRSLTIIYFFLYTGILFFFFLLFKNSYAFSDSIICFLFFKNPDALNILWYKTQQLSQSFLLLQRSCDVNGVSSFHSFPNYIVVNGW
jgi:hypothetical protein